MYFRLRDTHTNKSGQAANSPSGGTLKMHSTNSAEITLDLCAFATLTRWPRRYVCSMIFHYPTSCAKYCSSLISPSCRMTPIGARMLSVILREILSMRIEESTLHPVKVAVLEGAVDSPYIRMDPYFMIPAEDRNARDAMMKLVKVIDERIQEVILHPGDICFVDNYRAVHGRKPFKARYDGYDRWLKRINITRDLRKSRSQRKSAADRVIY